MLQHGPFGEYSILGNTDGTFSITAEGVDITNIFALSDTYVVIGAHNDSWIYILSQLVSVATLTDLQPVILITASNPQIDRATKACERCDIILRVVSDEEAKDDGALRYSLEDLLGPIKNAELSPLAFTRSERVRQDTPFRAPADIFDETYDVSTQETDELPLLDVNEIANRPNFYREIRDGLILEDTQDGGYKVHGVDPDNNGNIVALNAEQIAQAKKWGLSP
jgi:hypothetical protein